MDNTSAEPKHSGNRAMSQSTNNDGAALSANLKRLSLSTAAATALPSSSPIAPPMVALNGNGSSSPSSLNRSTKVPLRRAPSSSSIGSNERSTTPTLHKRASLNSLQGSGGATPPRSPAFRRTSSHLISSPNTSMGVRSSLPPPAEEPSPQPVTAASVAHDFFEKELEAHRTAVGVAGDPQTVVILQDDCYGHRYSRPRTSRANLATIVERPERIHASILGLAMAYVRLGGRHAEGRAAPHPKKHPSSLPPAPFKIQKTARRLPLRSPAATTIHGVQWMSELSAMCEAAESKLALSGKELTRSSATGQTNGISLAEKPKLHEGDLYLCSGSLNALEGALGGICEGVDAVFEPQGPKRAFVCIRPPGHHCSTDMPSGFCWLNNVHVGIGHAVLTHGLTHAAILDFDLHHGDGSQSITWAHNSRIASLPKNTPASKKTAIGYFSLHDINSYPCEMGDDEKVRNASLCIENAHGQTIWNVHLQPWKTDAEFWELYEDKYSVVLLKARNFLRLHSEKLRQAPTHPKPKAAIFLSAGFDASEWESPGMQRHQVNVPTDFYARLTRDVVMMAEEEGLGVDGRVISVLEGGYSDRALMSGVFSHISGLTVLTNSSRQQNMTEGLGQEMGWRLGKLEVNGHSAQISSNTTNGGVEAFDPTWWSLPLLEELETLVNPPASITIPKKQKSDTRPTYTSATQSYTAKIVSPPQGRRSFSGPGTNIQSSSIARSPSPPPPTVNWATAAHELSKLLVPSDRETRSCKPEDLNAEASRARRDRFSTVGLPASAEVSATDAKRMQLRDRRGKTPQYVSEDEEEKPLSRASRRKTIADVSLLAEDIEPAVALTSDAASCQPIKHTRRRSSIASNASSMTAERGSDFSRSSTTDIQTKREPLVVKKSRAPINPRPEAVKSKAVKKQSPITRLPPIPSAATNLENYQAPPSSVQSTIKAPLAVNEELKNKDVDQLASGMRTMSIKLNVPPRQEYEARETNSKPAARGRPPKSAVPKIAKAPSPTKAKVKAVKGPSQPKSLAAEPLIIQQLPPPVIASEDVQYMAVAEPPVSETPLEPAAPDMKLNFPAPFVSPPNPPNPALEPKADLPTYLHNLPSQEDDKVETPRPAPQPQGQIQQQSPEATFSNTPITAKRTKQDLPVFTSTSPISFGRRNSGISSNIDQAMIQGPDPTYHTNPYAPPPLSEQFDIAESAPAKERMLAEQAPPIEPPANSDLKAEPQPSASIWDIPDTPQPRKP